MLRAIGILIGLLLAIVVALFFTGIASMRHMEVIVMSTSRESSLADPFLLMRVRMLPACDQIDFTGPASPMEFVLNGYNLPDSDNERVLEVADILLEKGCDIDGHNTLGKTPLHVSILLAEPEVTAYLLSRSANPLTEAIASAEPTSNPFLEHTGMNALEYARSVLQWPKGSSTNDDSYAKRQASLRKIIDMLEDFDNEI